MIYILYSVYAGPQTLPTFLYSGVDPKYFTAKDIKKGADHKCPNRKYPSTMYLVPT